MIEWGFMCDDTWLDGDDEDWFLEEILFPLVDTGFSFWEVSVPPFLSPPWEEKICRWSTRLGIWISVHARFVGVNFAQYHPLLRQATLQVAMEDVSFAKRIGARQIVFHAGSVNWYDVAPPNHPYSVSLNQQFRRLRTQYMQMAGQILQTITRFTSSSGIFPLFENLYMPWEFPCTPEEVSIFRNLLGPETGFTLDTGHAGLTGYNLEAFLALSPQHIHLHVNDGQYDLHLLPKVQDENVQKILKYSKNCTVLVEVPPSLHREGLMDLLQNIQHLTSSSI